MTATKLVNQLCRLSFDATRSGNVVGDAIVRYLGKTVCRVFIATNVLSGSNLISFVRFSRYYDADY